MIEFLDAVLVCVAAVAMFLALIFIMARLGRWRRPLAPFYRRLGEAAPESPCPCGRPMKYGECCRAGDVQRLGEEVQSFLIQRWSHRTFAGRRWSRPLRDRLENYPLPRPALPEWVTQPEKFSFPISEELLRTWDPWRMGDQRQSPGA
jgi:hypothetical protein